MSAESLFSGILPDGSMLADVRSIGNLGGRGMAMKMGGNNSPNEPGVHFVDEGYEVNN
jgi:hypothetical protein